MAFAGTHKFIGSYLRPNATCVAWYQAQRPAAIPLTMRVPRTATTMVMLLLPRCSLVATTMRTLLLRCLSSFSFRPWSFAHSCTEWSPLRLYTLRQKST